MPAVYPRPHYTLYRLPASNCNPGPFQSATQTLHFGGAAVALPARLQWTRWTLPEHSSGGQLVCMRAHLNAHFRLFSSRLDHVVCWQRIRLECVNADDGNTATPIRDRTGHRHLVESTKPLVTRFVGTFVSKGGGCRRKSRRGPGDLGDLLRSSRESTLTEVGAS